MADTTTMSGRCAVCSGGMGHGDAIFTAECSHAFHLRCVPGTVCPVCGARWRDAPAAAATPDPATSVYADDEPVLDDPPELYGPGRAAGAGSGVLQLRAHCEYPALASGAAHDGVAVLVHARAPSPAAGRAPLDLVAALDVSGSMADGKLALVKGASPSPATRAASSG
ncbi:hypothetical protein ACP4OV_018590 [Aristida adscensionis]